MIVTKDMLFNAVGLTGVAIVLFAYFLQQYGALNSHGWQYLLMNIIGPIGIIISLLRFWNLPSFLLNASWVIISGYGLIKYMRSKA